MKDKRKIFVSALVASVCVLLGLHFLSTMVLLAKPVTPENVFDFSDPLTVLRIFLGIVGRLYVPITFWTLIWMNRHYANDPSFSESEMGKLTLTVGGAMLGIAQGPAFFSPGWLQGDLSPIYYALYPMGWCFLLVGIYSLPAATTLLFRSRPGIATLVIGLAWCVAGPLRRNIAPLALGWPIASILSLVVALCGVLSPKPLDRKLAIVGLILMSAQAVLGSLVGGVNWFQINTVSDPRVMEPLLLTGFLAWMAVILQITGLSNRIGLVLDKHPRET